MALDNRKVFRKGGGDEVNLPGKSLVCEDGCWGVRSKADLCDAHVVLLEHRHARRGKAKGGGVGRSYGGWVDLWLTDSQGDDKGR